MIFAGIVAGGSGTRMGSEIPKQFLPLKGKPVLIHTIEKFLALEAIDKVVLGVPEAYLEYTQTLLEQSGLDTERIELTAGASSRNGTILQIIRHLQEKCGARKEDWLITHDAVRPFVSERVLREHVSGANLRVVLGTVIPATDTIVVSESGNTIDSIPNRAQMYQAQTPQSFSIGEFAKQWEALKPEEKDKCSDACGVFVANHEKVKLVLGEKSNIKLTQQEDLLYAEMLLNSLTKQ